MCSNNASASCPSRCSRANSRSRSSSAPPNRRRIARSTKRSSASADSCPPSSSRTWPTRCASCRGFTRRRLSDSATLPSEKRPAAARWTRTISRWFSRQTSSTARAPFSRSRAAGRRRRRRGARRRLRALPPFWRPRATGERDAAAAARSRSPDRCSPRIAFAQSPTQTSSDSSSSSRRQHVSPTVTSPLTKVSARSKPVHLTRGSSQSPNPAKTLSLNLLVCFIDDLLFYNLILIVSRIDKAMNITRVCRSSEPDTGAFARSRDTSGGSTYTIGPSVEATSAVCSPPAGGSRENRERGAEALRRVLRAEEELARLAATRYA